MAARVTANLNNTTNVSTDIIGKTEEEVVTQEEFNQMGEKWLNLLSQENSSKFAREALIWNAKYDILVGDDQNNFMVKKLLTREEFIASLYRLYEVFISHRRV